jgi:hypothetical protein
MLPASTLAAAAAGGPPGRRAAGSAFIGSVRRVLERSSAVQVEGVMGDTDTMKLSSRLRQPRLLRRDWTGDAALVLVCGVLLTGAVFLPWVNEDGRGWVNFSFHGSGELNGVLQTHWGPPALLLALATVVLGVVMLLLPPRRLSWLLGALVALLGVAVFGVAQDAAAHIGYYDPGVGMYLTTLVGVLLVPIGLAAALVARFLSRADRDAAVAVPPTAPPAPENAPPS